MKLMIKMGFFCSDFLINCKNHNKKCLIIVMCFMALNILTCLSNKTLKQTRLKAISSKRLGFVFITDGKMIRMLSHNEACTLLSVIYSSGKHFKQCGKSPTSEGNQQLQAAWPARMSLKVQTFLLSLLCLLFLGLHDFFCFSFMFVHLLHLFLFLFFFPEHGSTDLLTLTPITLEIHFQV